MHNWLGLIPTAKNRAGWLSRGGGVLLMGSQLPATAGKCKGYTRTISSHTRTYDANAYAYGVNNFRQCVYHMRLFACLVWIKLLMVC